MYTAAVVFVVVVAVFLVVAVVVVAVCGLVMFVEFASACYR